jgi:hypothetical protein
MRAPFRQQRMCRDAGGAVCVQMHGDRLAPALHELEGEIHRICLLRPGQIWRRPLGAASATSTSTCPTVRAATG